MGFAAQDPSFKQPPVNPRSIATRLDRYQPLHRAVTAFQLPFLVAHLHCHVQKRFVCAIFVAKDCCYFLHLFGLVALKGVMITDSGPS